MAQLVTPELCLKQIVSFASCSKLALKFIMAARWLHNELVCNVDINVVDVDITTCNKINIHNKKMLPVFIPCETCGIAITHISNSTNWLCKEASPIDCLYLMSDICQPQKGLIESWKTACESLLVHGTNFMRMKQ